MASFFARHGAGEILARYSFVEPLLAGRRVLELGAAAVTGGASALLLAERGAAAVLSLTEGGPALEAARAAGHHPFVRFDDAPLESLPAGAFDLILLADGAPLADEPARLLGLRRLLAEGGHLVTAIPAAGGRSLAELAGDATPVQSPAYEAFIGALTEHFPWVEVATQSASVGYVIAVPPPQGEEAEVSIDGSQAGDADAAAYLALCGDGPTGLTGITMVALPARQLLDAAAASRQAEVAGAAQSSGAAERLEARLAELTSAGDAAAAEVTWLTQERAALAAERDRLLAERQLAADERLGLAQDREAAMAGEAAARAELERLARESHDGAEARERLALEHQERTQALEKLRSVEALCDAEREAGAAARADAERLGGLLGLRERELNELRAQAEALRLRLAEAELEAARLGEERTRAVTELAERSGAGVETEAGLGAARTETQVARNALEGSLARADAAEARVQELEEGLDRRATELGALRAELAAARALAAGAAEDGQAQRERLEAVEATLGTTRGELDRLREEAVTGRGEAEVALRELDEARGEAARATSVLAELRVELRATGEALEEARGLLEAARSSPPPPPETPAPAPPPVPDPALELRLAELTAEAARLAGERDGLAAMLEEDHRKAAREREQLAAQLDEARAAAEGELTRARQAVETAEGQAATARRAAEVAEEQAAELGAELQAVRWEKEEVEQRLFSLRELERDAPAEPAASAPGEVARLRAELEAARADAEALVRVVAEKEQLIAGLADRDLRIARLQRELADKTDRLGRLATEMGELKAKGIGKIFR